MSADLKKYKVFSIRKTKTGTVWVRAGNAFSNRDGSLNVHLDVLPLDGALHLRDVDEIVEVKPEPDLIEALEATLELAAQWAEGKAKSHVDHEVIAAARAAVAKARGR